MKKIVKEQLYITHTNPIKARQYNYRYFTYPWHFHSEFELMYVEHGEGICMVGDAMLPYSDHTLFLFGSELPHWIQNNPTYQEDESQHVNGTIVQFEKDFMQYSFSNYIQFGHIQNVLNCSNRGIAFQLNNHPTLQKMMMEFPLIEGIEQIILLLRLLQQLSQIPEQRMVASPNFNLTLAGYKDNRIEKIIAYINKKYTEPLYLNDVAAFASMNPTAFCRYFKENVGKTLKEYIIEMRIGYACKLLSLSHFNVSQIGIECGFETISHFNRCFKRITGYSPTEYKEKLER